MWWFKKNAKKEQLKPRPNLLSVEEGFEYLYSSHWIKDKNRVDSEELMSILTSFNIVEYKGKFPTMTHRLVMPSGVVLSLNVSQNYSTKQTILADVYMISETEATDITPFPKITSIIFKGRLVEFLESVLAQDTIYHESNQHARI